MADWSKIKNQNQISVNHAIISSYPELNVFKKVWFVGEISNKRPKGLFGKKVYNTLESCW